MSSGPPRNLQHEAAENREAQREAQRKLTGEALYPAEAPDYDQPLPEDTNPGSLRNLVSTEALVRDPGDVKAATGNKSFDEGEGRATAATAASPPAAAHEHLEPSREPSKPGCTHPVMDSSK